ncbi:MAG: hypothetical protein Fur0044_29910 [Anaerolineae bacterium]|nr:HEAT repeat domain-containing protein [Anaerolineales bacterium]MCQ3973067.1 hypothetical protein [Anaerolineae bacterium]
MKIERLVCPSCGGSLSGDFLPNKKFECPSCGTALLITDLATDQTVLCPQCQTPNREELRYCSNCGGSLKVDCILCHSLNRIDGVYCAHCGAHLERARAKRAEMQEIRRRVQFERLEALKEKEARQQQERIERLITALDEPENHQFAIFQLNQLGDEAVDALVETLLNDDDPDARYGSAIALGRICAERDIKALNKAKATRALIKALNDSEPVVRFWAAEALGKFKSAIARQPLAALLKDSHQGVRQQARRSLEKLVEAKSKS